MQAFAFKVEETERVGLFLSDFRKTKSRKLPSKKTDGILSKTSGIYAALWVVSMWLHTRFDSLIQTLKNTSSKCRLIKNVAQHRTYRMTWKVRIDHQLHFAPLEIRMTDIYWVHTIRQAMFEMLLKTFLFYLFLTTALRRSIMSAPLL